MPTLFTYGTLQDTSIQLRLFGRSIEGKKDIISGFTRTEVEIVDLGGELLYFPVLIPGPVSAEIVVKAYELSEEELLICDEYEGNEYKRIPIHSKTGIQGWVYVIAS